MICFAFCKHQHQQQEKKYKGTNVSILLAFTFQMMIISIISKCEIQTSIEFRFLLFSVLHDWDELTNDNAIVMSVV